MKKAFWFVLIIIVIALLFWLWGMKTGAHAQELKQIDGVEYYCIDKGQDGYVCDTFTVASPQSECTIYERKPCNPEPIVYAPAKPTEPLFRRVFINHLALSIGYENRGMLGYKAGVVFGLTHELDYRAKLLLRNSLSFSPAGKVLAGGYYLQYDSRAYYMLSRVRIGGGVTLGYTDNSSWHKLNIFGATSVGYMISDGKYKSILYGDFIFGKYFDEAKTTQVGFELLNISDLPYRFLLISKLGFYQVGSDAYMVNARNVMSATIAIGYKI